MTPEEEAQLAAMKVEDQSAAPPEEKAPVQAEAPKPVTPDKNKLEFEGKTYIREAALSEARNENRELKAQMQQLQSVVSEGDKKLQQFLEGLRKQTEAGPKFEEDPGRHLKHENEQLKAQIDQITQRMAVQDQGSQENARLQRFAAHVSAKEAAFAKTTPDYFEAAKHVQEAWADEFREAGFDEEQIPSLLVQKSIGVTQQAVQKEKDPAEAIYRIAKRFGFAGKTATTAKPDGDTKLQALAKGQEAAKTATGGGGSGDDDVTFAALAQMESSQIDKLVNDPAWWDKHIRQSPLQ